MKSTYHCIRTVSGTPAAWNTNKKNTVTKFDEKGGWKLSIFPCMKNVLLLGFRIKKGLRE